MVDFDLARFFHLLAKVVDEQTKQFTLLLLHQRVANFVFLLGEFIRRGFLLFQDLEYRAGGAAIDGPADLARFQGEGDRGRSSHGSHIRHLTVRQNEVARLERGAQFLGSLLQVVFRLSPV